KEQGLKKLVFDTDELKSLASSSRKYRWEETITTAVKKIGQLTYFEQTERKFRVMTLFEIFEVDLEKRTIEVKVSANFDYILNKLETHFTRYELEEFTSIRSTYAKTMYRILKQWRTLGKKEFAIEDLKRILDMPTSYKSSEIDRAVIKPIIQQLSPYFEDLKVKKIKSNKRGNPVLGYEFTWNAEKSESYDPNKFNKPKQKQKRQSNVPSWSNTDYVNTTSEETKAELERKKQEMLARLNRSESHEVQTDIYDFLD
ncbi:MAG: RepB family plasmid replication initiator protein, partial [Streptococcus salivarius]|nr:RepB family plasmid replication initiator protein [Streptococcus salivarius]